MHGIPPYFSIHQLMEVAPTFWHYESCCYKHKHLHMTLCGRSTFSMFRSLYRSIIVGMCITWTWSFEGLTNLPKMDGYIILLSHWSTYESCCFSASLPTYSILSVFREILINPSSTWPQKILLFYNDHAAIVFLWKHWTVSSYIFVWIHRKYSMLYGSL